MIELPAHLSYSALNSYTTCGMRYWIERMCGEKGGTSWALLGGSAIHEMTADHDHGVKVGHSFAEYLQEQIDYKLAAGLAEESISATGRASKEWPNKRDKSWWLHNGPVIFNRWLSWSAVCPWERLVIREDGDPGYPFCDGVEFEVSGHIGDNYIKAYVDRAYVLPSGEAAVLDIKTGTSKPYDNLQLGVYAVLMEKTLGVRPSFGYYWMAETGGTAEPVDLTRYTEEYLDLLFSGQRRGIEAGVFLPNVTPMCSACGVREFCPAVGGARSSEIPTPRPVV